MSQPITATDHRIPVTLLTGFLGAGKTTLLNSILSKSNESKIAVVVNEFGDAGLDHDLIETVDEDVVLMPSGCLCCSVREDLARTLWELTERAASGTLAFDRIVIETTGLADPVPILQTFLVDRFLARTFRIDGVVTMVDAVNGPNSLDQQFEAVSQVAMADLLVLSKTDLAQEQNTLEFETRLRALNTTAPMLRADHGEIPVAQLWGVGGMRHEAKPEKIKLWVTPAAAPAKIDPFANLSGLAKAPDKSAPKSSHDALINTASIVLDEPISVEAFDFWLDTFVLLRGAHLLRVKGIVHLEGIEFPFVFHGVQQVFDPPVPLHNWSKEDRQSRIVVIARDMTEAEIIGSFSMLYAKKKSL